MSQQCGLCGADRRVVQAPRNLSATFTGPRVPPSFFPPTASEAFFTVVSDPGIASCGA